jgi:TRAP-type C4-dicarboxylate transport system permease small subunit
MDTLFDLLNWAWARHHNPFSWYIRPLFILPFCYFAYKMSARGMEATVVAVTSSMFWFPAPATPDPAAATFLAVEREWITGL